MKIMVGTANLNQGAANSKIRSTSVRLTKALSRQQKQEEPKPEVFDLRRALQSAQMKAHKPKPPAKLSLRRDPLAAAKAAAVIRGWKEG